MRTFELRQTGTLTLKAGLPANWRIGDKTGTASDTSNDIAIITPPHREPLLVAAYYTNDKVNSAVHKAVLAKVGGIAAKM